MSKQTDPTFLGTVQDVRGATVSVALDVDTISGLAFLDGHGYRIGQVGSFIRIPVGYIDLFGVVSQVGAGAVPERLMMSEPGGYRWMTVQLVGEGQSQTGFKRGISQFPTVGDPAHLVTERDLATIYGRPNAPQYVPIGNLASSDSIPALVNVDRLITRHSAVLGATGTGKSTTVAGLLACLSDEQRYPSARIMVLDIHGEYAAALRDRASVLKISPDASKSELPLYIPYWAMNSDELLSITFGELDDLGRAAILERLTNLKRESLARVPRKGITEQTVTADSPIPFSLHQLWFDLWCEINATFYEKKDQPQNRDTWALELDASSGQPVQVGDADAVIAPKFRPIKDVSGDTEKIRLSKSPLNVRRPLERLTSRLRDPRFAFLFAPGPWRPDKTGTISQDVDSLLRDWFGGEKSVSILDLSGIPASILHELLGALLRIVFESLFWSRDLCEGARERPLLLVLEEAHAYLNPTEGGPASLAVKRIAKEGRKYGVGLMIVSQRPAEIDQTILSQCGTLIAMRLANSSDRAHVLGMVTENLEGLFNMLPVLRTGEAVIVGEAVHLPVRTIISPPPVGRRPESSDPQVYVMCDDEMGPEAPGGWNRRREATDYSDVAAVWRKQSPRSERIVTVPETEEPKDEQDTGPIQ